MYILNDKKHYVVYIRTLKQSLNRRVVLKKIYKVIKFNRKAWLKSYVDMNTELEKMQKMTLKNFFSS